MIATGQILLCAPAELGVDVVFHDEIGERVEADFHSFSATFCSSWLPDVDITKPKEPWRRGRPLRR